MNKLLDTKLFEILERPISNDADLQTLLTEFSSQLYYWCQTTTDYASLYRTLTCTRIRIEQIQDLARSKKKCAYRFSPALC